MPKASTRPSLRVSKPSPKAASFQTGKGAPKCPECGSLHFFEDDARGERGCAKCGLVLEEAIADTSPEWRAFDDEQRSKRSRAGAPLTHSKHDKGLTTEIG